MAYTVKQLSQLASVSIRTLHYYDEIGLLKPAYYGENGYRFYEEKQLLLLQQILFFRELGFDLSKIKRVLKCENFALISTLSSHKVVLKKEMERIEGLIQTIDKTIMHIKGEYKMQDYEMYLGFSKEKQTEYQEYLINRFGGKVKTSITESYDNLKNWNKADFAKSKLEYEHICRDLAELWKQSFAPNSQLVQEVISRHYEWLKNYWKPDRESYINLGEGYKGFEWKKVFQSYDSEHPKFATFLAEGMQFFAENNL